MARRRGTLLSLVVAGAMLTALAAWWNLRMPGSSHSGALPELDERERALMGALESDVEELATKIGERHAGRPDALARAADYVEERLARAGHSVERHSFEARGQRFDNLVAEIPGLGRAAEIVVIGAHYDGAIGTPAANDNASGVAALLALADALPRAWPRTVRLVAFVNEEPPFFQTPAMGSLVYAARCKARSEQVVAMLSLETMGYYRDEPGSQRYPFPLSLFYPDRGDFIAFVGSSASRELVERVTASFRRHARFPSEGAAMPASTPGVGWSDHWSFWQQGYPALMVTDTAPFRYPHYHEADDTPEQLDFERLARVVQGLRAVVDDLAGASME